MPWFRGNLLRYLRPLFLVSQVALAAPIVRIEIYSNDPLSIIYVHTADGITGMGQVGRSQSDSTGILTDADLVIETFLRHIAPVAHLRNVTSPKDLEALRQDIIYQNYKNTGQVFFRALSGLDTALWDVLAKQANQSVCQYVGNLVGRPCRKRVNFYCTNITRAATPEELTKLILQLHAKYGATGYKLKVANIMGRNTDFYPNRTIQVIPQVRAALEQQLGPGIRLMVDANGGYEDLRHVTEVAQILNRSDYFWFEEPVPFWNYDLTKQVRDLGLVRIAGGENEYRESLLEHAVTHRQVDIVQPDFGYVGGFSVALRIAQLAARHGVGFDPHSPDLSLTEFFSVHLMGVMANDDTLFEYGCTDGSTPLDIFEQGLQASGGSAPVPTGVGWGVAVQEAWLSRAEQRVYPITGVEYHV